MRERMWLMAAIALATAGLIAGGTILAGEEPAKAAGSVVLGAGTTWRMHVTWRTPVVVTAAGEMKPLLRRKRGGGPEETEPVPAWQSQAPPAEWVKPDFDDSSWARSHPPHGVVSWYGEQFHDRPTASGELFDANAMTMAHPTLPFGTRVKVTNLRNGRSVVVRVNDRGPFVSGRMLDLSLGAARKLDMVDDGVVEVRVEVVSLGEP